ncbi:uncharacterized protein SPAPADRAFT_60705 [Spathaspora passalidarum NRRL Y-27907]|uniref:Cytochrome c oxidase subunit 8, mitochondrial n=1 Tax=Spathaspora passalidarum (strain NRRL Y-27907 / 11-Y1) TaxID=619300 RepID=G3AM11_SPAPN|nr:uncharacterized protein SPAPADRAFT_60705 [Spathaspora passalidarum NRRL Y-27907]EGW33364.1 hypothetical protein SPAPADRAFT_60705 [Spathaspora passalidarum NRRL Y-27907]
MLTRLGLRGLPSTARTTARRNFQSSARAMNEIYGTPAEGPYSNIPFKVVGRKVIPFSVFFFGIMGTFFAFPFITTWWHLKKSGSLAKSD